VSTRSGEDIHILYIFRSQSVDPGIRLPTD